MGPCPQGKRPSTTQSTKTAKHSKGQLQSGTAKAAAAKTAAQAGVYIGDKLHPFDNLPPSMGRLTQAAAQRARSWCEMTGSVAIVDDRDRFVLVAPAGLSGMDRFMSVAVKTANWLDEELPSTANQMPPLPEGQYQDDLFMPDGSAAIIYVLDTEADQARLVEFLVKEEPSLAGWRKDAAGLAGFHLLRPLCAGVVLQVAGNEEWSPEHEVVSRTAKVLAQRRFGVLPYWFAEGLGWAAEWKYDRQLYCFSHRDEFIFTVEHGAWGKNVTRKYEKRAKSPIEPKEVEALKRGVWNIDAAEYSFGLTSWLLQQDPHKLSMALEAMRVIRDRENRQPLDNGGWTRIPGWDLPADSWDKEFARQYGADWRFTATKDLAKGLRNL